MKANELRVNNILGYDDSIEKVISINTNCWIGDEKVEWIGTENFEGELITLFKPIPLTEDWLIRFGFELDEDTESWSILTSCEKSDYLLELSKKYQEYFQPDFIRLDVKYVHQLQNLYFALTGKELTLKN